MNKRQNGRPTNGAADNKEARRGSQRTNSFVPRTELGRRLLRIRQRILASGQPLLDWDDIESQLRERRGEANEEPRN
jgi:hypothetical protein